MKKHLSKTLIKYLSVALLFCGAGFGAMSYADSSPDRVVVDPNSTGTSFSDKSSLWISETGGYALGGAIFNYLQGSPTPAITLSGNFKGNYALSETGQAIGGAVFSRGDVTIYANGNSTTEFSGNYTQSNGGQKQYNAIFLWGDQTLPTLTLNAMSENSWVKIMDSIDGARGNKYDDREAKYNLDITGAGTVQLGSSVKNANANMNNASTTLIFAPNSFNSSTGSTLNVDAGTVSLVDAQTQTYNIDKFTSNSAVNYILEYNKGSDITPSSIDKLSLGSGSEGTITLSALKELTTGNLITTASGVILSEGETSKTFTNVVSGGNVTLRVAEALLAKEYALQNVINFSEKDKYSKKSGVLVDNGNLTLYKDYVYSANVLKRLNEQDSHEKKFNFDIDGQVYYVPQGDTLGTTKNDLTISGRGQGLSTITSEDSVNGSQFFTLLNSSAASLNILNLTLSNAKGGSGSVANVSNGKLTLTGVEVLGSDSSSGAFYVEGAGSMDIYSSSFKNNNATTDGGVIYNWGGTINIVDSVFDGNSSTTKTPVTGISRSGAIYNSSQAGSVINMFGVSFNTKEDSIFNDGTINISKLEDSSITLVNAPVTGSGTLNVSTGAELKLGTYGTISEAQKVKLSDNAVLSIANPSTPLVLGADDLTLKGDNKVYSGIIKLLSSGAKLVLKDRDKITIGNLQGVTGSVLKNSGSTINVDNSSIVNNFDGDYIQDGGSLTITDGQRVFSGKKTINSGRLEITAQSTNATNIYLGDNVSYVLKGYNQNAITNNNVVFEGQGATAEFTNMESRVPQYILSSINGDISKENTVVVSNATLFFADNNYSDNLYKFKDVTSSFVNEGQRDELTFNNLTIENGGNGGWQIKVDLFAEDGSTSNDVINILNSKGVSGVTMQKIILKDIVLNGSSSNFQNGDTFRILDLGDGVNISLDISSDVLNNSYSADFRNIVYSDDRFETKTFGAMNKDGQYVENPTDTDQIVGLIVKSGEKNYPLELANNSDKFATKYFAFKQNGETYTLHGHENNYIGETLTTTKGTLNINTGVMDGSVNVPSYENVTIDAKYDGAPHSLFYMGAGASITAKNVTFKHAEQITPSEFDRELTPGSVFFNTEGSLTLNNVIFEENKGYALANHSSNLVNLTNVTFRKPVESVYVNGNNILNTGALNFAGANTIETTLLNIGETKFESDNISSNVLTLTGTIENRGSLLIKGSTDIKGRLVNNSGANIEITGLSTSALAGINSGASIENSGRMTFTNTSINLNEKQQNKFSNLGEIYFNGKNKISNTAFNIGGESEGTVNFLGTQLELDNADINLNKGTFEIAQGSQLYASEDSGRSNINIGNETAFTINSRSGTTSVFDSFNKINWKLSEGAELNLVADGSSGAPVLSFDSGDEWAGKITLENAQFVVESTFNNGSFTFGENYIVGDSYSLFKNNGVDFTLRGKNNAYQGTYEQLLGGTFTSNSENLFTGRKSFAGTSSSNPVNINITDQVSNFAFNDIYLGSYSNLNVNATGGEIIQNVFNFNQGSTAVKVTFDSSNSAMAKYTLSPINWGNNNLNQNAIWFKNTELKFTTPGSYTGPKYILENSLINTWDRQVSSNPYTFAYLYSSSNTQDSRFSNYDWPSEARQNLSSVIPWVMDVDIANGVADNIEITSGAGYYDYYGAERQGGLTLRIAKINFLNPEEISTGDAKGKLLILKAPTGLVNLEYRFKTPEVRYITPDVDYDQIISIFSFENIKETIDTKDYFYFKYSINNFMDLLHEWNTTSFSGYPDYEGRDRTFNFTSSEEPAQVFGMTMNSGNTYKGKFSIVGKNAETNVIDAKNTYSMFNFVDKYTEDGVVHNIDGSITFDVDNVTLTRAYKSISSSGGGSVFNLQKAWEGYNHKLTIKNSIISESSVQADGNASIYGGAINIQEGIVKIENSTFDKNYVMNGIAKGGAIYLSGTGSLTLKNTSFTDNHAESSNGTSVGGAIYTTNDLTIEADGSTATEKTKNVVFSKNYYLANDSQVFNAVFVDVSNPASPTTLTLKASNGGTISFNGDSIEGGYGTDGSYNQFNLNIEGNNQIKLSSLKGANLYAGTNSKVVIDSANITDSNLNFVSGSSFDIQNTNVSKANSNRRAVQTSSTPVTIVGSTFKENTGGAVGVNGSSLKFTQTNIFRDNSITSGGSYVGAAISVIGASIDSSPLNGSFVGNSLVASDNYAVGGAVYISGATSTFTFASDFTDNYARVNTSDYRALGGAIYSDSNIKLLANDTENELNISGNYTVNNGVKEYNAIFIDTSADSRTIEMTALNEGNSININDIISGGRVDDRKNASYGDSSEYNITVGGGVGSVNINNLVRNAIITQTGGNLTFNGGYEYNNSGDFVLVSGKRGDLLQTSSDITDGSYSTLTVNGGNLNLSNMVINNAAKILKVIDGNLNLLNSVINTADNNNAADTVKLGKLVINDGYDKSTESGTKFAIDFQFLADSQSNDKFEVFQASAGDMWLDVNWIGDQKNVKSGFYEVVTSNDSLVLHLIDDKVWEYVVQPSGVVEHTTYIGTRTAKIGTDENNNCIEIADDQKDTLYELSIFEGSTEPNNKRTFKFVSGSGVDNTYHLLSDLYLDDNIYPASGELVIDGRGKNTSVIDGTYEDEYLNEHHHAMYIIKNNPDVDIKINNLTIQNIGAYSDPKSSVAFLDKDTAKLSLSGVNLKDNEGYAIYNRSGLVNLYNVYVYSVDPEKDWLNVETDNQIYNAANSEADGRIKGGLVITGASNFNTKITNEGLMSVSGNNTFKADIANTGTLRFTGGTNDLQGSEDNEMSLYSGISGAVSGGSLVISNGVLNIKNYATVDTDQDITFTAGTINILGGTLNLDENDMWGKQATIVVGNENDYNDNSVLNYSGVSNNPVTYTSPLDRGKLTARSGYVNVKDESTLYVTSTDTLGSAVKFNLEQGSKLYIAGHTNDLSAIKLNVGEDVWAGDIVLDKSYLDLSPNTDGVQDFSLRTKNMLTSVPDNVASGNSSTSTFRNRGINLTIDAEQDFNGTYIQNDLTTGETTYTPSLTINALGTFFGEESTKKINSGIVTILREKNDVNPTGEIDFANVELASGVEMYVASRGGDISPDIVKFIENSSGALAQFYAVNTSTADDYYTLHHIAYGTNTVFIGNEDENSKMTNLKLGRDSSNNYDYGYTAASVFTTYKLANVNVDIANDPLEGVEDSQFTEYKFAALDVRNNVEFNIDVDFDKKKSDTILIAKEPSGEGEARRIINLNISSIPRPLDTSSAENIILKVLGGNAVNSYKLELKTDSIVEYEYDKAKTDRIVYNDYYTGSKVLDTYQSADSETLDSIILYSDQSDTLRAVNMEHIETNRTFQFRNSRDELVYNPVDNSGITKKGTMGVSGDPTHKDRYVIDAKNTNIVKFNPDSKTEDIIASEENPAYFTLFWLANPGVTFTMEGVTVRNAVIGDGDMISGASDKAAVFDIAAGNTVRISDTTFRDNAIVDVGNGVGNAIYNAGTLNFNGGVLFAHSAEENCNMITNADTGIINVQTLSENSDDNVFETKIDNSGTINIAEGGNMLLSGGANIENLELTNAKINVSGNLRVDKNSEVVLNEGTSMTVSGTLSGRTSSDAGSVDVKEYSTLNVTGLNAVVAEALDIKINGNLNVTGNYSADNNKKYGVILSSGDIINDEDDNNVNIVLKEGGALSLRKGLNINDNPNNDNFTIKTNNVITSESQNTYLYNGVSSNALGLDGLTIKIGNEDNVVDARGYSGNFYQYGAGSKLIVAEGSHMFGGTNYIEENSSVEVTSGRNIDYQKIYLGRSASLTHYATTDLGGIINDNVVKYTNTGATALFTTKGEIGPDEPIKAQYSLAPITPSAFTANIRNNLTIENGIVTLSGKNNVYDYSAASNGSYVAYKFINSEVNLSDGRNELRNYIFSNLETENTSFTMDVDLAQYVDGSYMADTITVADRGTAKGIVKLSDINFLNRSEKTEGIVRVLIDATDDFYLDIADMLEHDTEGKYKWEYSIDPETNKVNNETYIGKKDLELYNSRRGIASSEAEEGENIYADSLKITNIQIDTLAAINQYLPEEEGTIRKFEFLNLDGIEDQTYTSIDKAGVSAQGEFHIVGRNYEMYHFKDTIDADSHSLFEVINPTDLKISDVDIKNASNIIHVDPDTQRETDLNASVLYVNNPNAKVSLKNVVLENNRNNAIANESGTVTLENVELKESASPLGNAIYNNSKMTTKGVNKFSTRVVNAQQGADTENAVFTTEGKNTFEKIIENYGTINFGGSDDSVVGIVGDGNVNVKGTKVVTTGSISDDTVFNVADAGKFVLSGTNAQLKLSNGEKADTWATKGTISLEGGTLNIDGISSNGYFTSTSGNLNINSGRFTLKSATTSTDDLANEVVVSVKGGATFEVTDKEHAVFDSADYLHEDAKINLIGESILTLSGITFEEGTINPITRTDEININKANMFTSLDDIEHITTSTLENKGVDVNINVDQSDFTGIYLQTGNKTTTVATTGKVFGGAKQINNGKLKIYSAGDEETSAGGIYYKDVRLGESGKLEHYNINDIGGVINSDVLKFTNTGGIAKFSKEVPSGVEDFDYVNYELASNINNNQANTVIFDSANLKLTATNSPAGSTIRTFEYTGGTTYRLVNSYLSLGNDDETPVTSVDNYQFTNLEIGDNVRASIDVDGKKIKSFDKITAANATGTLIIDKIKWVTEPVINDGQVDAAPMRILFLGEGSTLQLVLGMPEEDRKWEYSIEKDYITSTGNVDVKHNNYVGGKELIIATSKDEDATENDSIAFKYSREDLLKAVNTYVFENPEEDRTRTFSFDTEDSYNLYKLIDNSAETTAGTMYVKGVEETRPAYMSVIDAVSTYSLFNIRNNTDMTVQNVIIQNAVISTTPKVMSDILAENASVFDITNENANVKLSNVILRNNKDRAIYNYLGNVELQNVTIENTKDGFDSNIDNIIENAGGTIVTLGTNTFNTAIKNTNYDDSDIIFAGDNTINGVVTNDRKGKIYVGVTTANYVYDGDTVVKFNNDVQNAGQIIVDSEAQFAGKLTSLNNTYGNLDINENGSVTVVKNGEIEKDNVITVKEGGKLNINQGKVTLDKITDNVDGTITLGVESPVAEDTSELHFKGVTYDEENGVKYVFKGNSGSLYIEDNSKLELDMNDTLADAVDVHLDKGTLNLDNMSDRTTGKGIVKLSEGDSWSDEGKVNLVNSEVVIAKGLNENSTLTLGAGQLAGNADETLGAKFTNKGVDVTISGDVSAFEGVYSQMKETSSDVSKLTVTEEGVVFAGDKYIYGGDVVVRRSGNIDFNKFYLGATSADQTAGAAKFELYSTGGNINTDSDNPVVDFLGDANDSQMIFNNVEGSTERAKYELGRITGVVNKFNTVTFNNSEVTLNVNYETGNNYNFNNSVVSFQKDILIGEELQKFNNYNFTKIINDENTTYAIDVDLAGFLPPDAEKTPQYLQNSYADTLTVTDATSQGNVVLSDIKYFGTLDQYAQSRLKILNNPSENFRLALTDEVANTKWDYTLDSEAHKVNDTISINYNDFLGTKNIKVAKYDENSSYDDSIEIYNGTTKNILREINMYENSIGINRKFIFQEEGTYKLVKNNGDTAGNAGVTTEGKFDIIGYVEPEAEIKPPVSIIDGDGKYSIFQIKNTTEMKISNVEFKSAKNLDDNGSEINASVLDIENRTADVTLDNVVFTSNAGNAIYNMGKLTMMNVNVAEGSPTAANTVVNAANGAMVLNATNEFNTNFTNKSNAVITLLGINNFKGNFVNEGQIIVEKEDSETPIVSVENIKNTFADLTNKGSIETLYGSTTFGGVVNNTGTITLGANDVIENLFEGSGDLIIKKSSKLPEETLSTSVQAGGIIDNSVKLTVDNNGHLALVDGTVNINTGDIWKQNGKISLKDVNSVLNYNDITENGIFSAEVGTVNLQSGTLTVRNTDLLDNKVNVKVLAQDDKIGTLALVNRISDEDALVLSAGDEWSGKINLSNSKLFTDNELTTDGKLVLGLKDNLTGDVSSVYKDNGLNLLITADQSGFKGTFELNEGAVLTVYEKGYTDLEDVTGNGVVFGGQKLINNGTVNMFSLEDIDYGNFLLGGGVHFNNYTTGGRVDTSVFTFSGDTNDALAVFGSVNDEQARYNLSSFNTTSSSNILKFVDSYVTFNDSIYSDKTVYKFSENTTIDTQDENYTAYNINNLVNEAGATYKINIDFATLTDKVKLDGAGIADTFALGAGSSGNFVISDIDFDEFNNFNVNYTEGIIRILSGEGLSNSRLTLTDELANKTWGQTVKDFDNNGVVELYADTFIGLKHIKTVNYTTPEVAGSEDSIEIYATDVDDTLHAINTYQSENPINKRYFRFKEGSANVYHLGKNTGSTTPGEMNVVGLKNGNSIIDALNHDDDGNDTYYSMFVLNQDVTLNISDVTIQNAAPVSTTDGRKASVIDMSNGNAVANISDVTFTDN